MYNMTTTHRRCYLSALVAYFTFGVLHELVHLAFAHFCGLVLVNGILDSVRWEKVLLEMTFCRRLCFDVKNETRLDIDEIASLESKAALVRHAGWMSSVLIAFFIHFWFRRYLQKNVLLVVPPPPSSQYWSWCIFAGYLTALDAIWTDLLRLKQIYPLNGEYIEVKDPDSLVFYCGNFGLILLHGAWLDKNGGQSALDILEKMVEGKNYVDYFSRLVRLFKGIKPHFRDSHMCSYNDERGTIW